MNSAEKRAARIGLTALLVVFRAAQARIVSHASAASSTRWSQREEDIRKQYAKIRGVWAAYISESVPVQYSKAKQAAGDALGAVLERMPEYRTADRLIADSIAKMNLATVDGEARVKELFRRTQQAVLDDAEISRKLAEGMVMESTPKNLSNILRDELYRKIVGDRKVLEINGRMYRADYYAELVARTRTREAQSAATLDVCLYAGEDLVRISKHNTSTPLCKEFEGKTFSVSGRSDQYPKLDRTPPFHPNCQHVLTARVA